MNACPYYHDPSEIRTVTDLDKQFFEFMPKNRFIQGTYKVYLNNKIFGINEKNEYNEIKTDRLKFESLIMSMTSLRLHPIKDDIYAKKGNSERAYSEEGPTINPGVDDEKGRLAEKAAVDRKEEIRKQSDFKKKKKRKERKKRANQNINFGNNKSPISMLGMLRHDDNTSNSDDDEGDDEEEGQSYSN